LKNTLIQLKNTPIQLKNTPIQGKNTPIQLKNTPIQLKNTPIQLKNTPIQAKNTVEAVVLVVVVVANLLSPFPGYGKIPGLCIQFSGISISRACLTI